MTPLRKNLFLKKIGRYTKVILQRGLVVSADRFNHFLVAGMTVPIDSGKFLSGTPWSVTTNMVRFAFLELCAREIERRGVLGDIAEVGVGAGCTATMLNQYFPTRKLLLFDTFRGFDRHDLDRNEELGFGREPYPAPSHVVEDIMAQLLIPSNAEFHLGRFPETVSGLEHRRFALVHVDVGLYEPTYSALQWFHGRVCLGGYLLVADYEHHCALGVKAAVQQFAREAGISYVVLPDRSGTAVFAL